MTEQVLIFGRAERPALHALLTGLAVVGLRPVMQRPHYSASDTVRANVRAVFVDGWHHGCRAYGELYQRHGVPVYVVDLPRLRASSTIVATTAGIFPETLHALPLRVGNVAPVRGVLSHRTDEYVLVCGQKPDDAAHGMSAAQGLQWARDTVALCRQQYGYPVHYRPHPAAGPVQLSLAMAIEADGVNDPRQESLRTALQRCAALVTHNSTSGVDAIDAGVPVLYTAAPSAVCYADYAVRLGAAIRVLTANERRTFLMRCAATQWTFTALADGTAARCLLQGDPWPVAQEWRVLDADEAGRSVALVQPPTLGTALVAPVNGAQRTTGDRLDPVPAPRTPAKPVAVPLATRKPMRRGR